MPELSINGKNKFIKLNQSAEDIIKYLRIAEAESRFIYPILRAYFITDNPYTTLNKIWNYAKKNIVYVREPASDQTVRTVPRIVREGTTKGGDCKHMATFCVSSARACGINSFFRLVSFNEYNSSPTHVYAVAMIGQKKVYLDAVINNFDEEPKHIKFFQDVKPLNN
jgi:hypothetical protein